MLILIKIEIIGKLQMIRFYIKIFNIMDLIFYIINILLLIYYGFKNKINNINNEQIFLFALSLYYYDTINKNLIQYIFFILMIKNCILVYLYKTIRMEYDI